MKFSTKGHGDDKEFVSNYMKPGIQEVRLVDLEAITSAGGTEGIQFNIEGRPMEALEGKAQRMETRFWLSPKAQPHTMGTIKQIAKALGLAEELDAIEADTTEGFCSAVTTLLGNKFFRTVVVGQEIEGKDDKPNWFKGEFGFYAKCESLTVEPSTLSFDETRHLKKIETPDVEEMASEAAKEPADKLPF